MDIIKVKRSRHLLSRRNVLLALGVLAIAIASMSLANLGQALPTVSRSGLWADTAQRGNMLREIRASGVLAPRDLRWITAGTAATVQEVLVLAGATVEEDTIIMRLANSAVEINLARAKAAMVGAEADLAAKRAGLRSAALDQKTVVVSAQSTFQQIRLKSEALQRGYDLGAVPQLDLEQSRIALEQARQSLDIEQQRVAAFEHNLAAQLQAAKAQRDERQSTLAIAQQEADALNVKAQIAGIVQQVSVDPGQQVAVGAPLARVAKPDPLVARLRVPEILAKDLSLGLPVRVDTHNGIAEGRISRIDPAVREGSVQVDVAFDRSLPAGARPDLSVDGRIALATLQDVISIGRPAQARSGDSGSLFVLAADRRTAHRRRVVYGATSSDRIEVVEGLAAGEQTILSDTSQWAEYESLRVQ